MRRLCICASVAAGLAACAGRARFVPRAEPAPAPPYEGAPPPAEAPPPTEEPSLAEAVRAEKAEAKAPEPAAAIPAEPGYAAPAKAQPDAVPRPKPVYERILGSYSVDPHLVVYLNPALCARHCRSGAWPAALAEIPKDDSARNVAVAHLHRGALLWIEGFSERAYREIMQARYGFAALGDVQGLAHTYEWLGYLFRQSRATDRAAEHFSIAYRMFELMGNRAAAERVLGYAQR